MSGPNKTAVLGSNRKLPDAILDGESGVPPFMTRTHNLVHQGLMYNITITNAAFDEDDVEYIQIQTGDEDVHLKEIDVTFNGPQCTVEILEAPTVTDGDAAIPIVNRNRSPVPPATTVRAAEAVAYSNPTNISDGTTLDEVLILGGEGVGNTSGVGAIGDEAEWVLKADTDYIISFTNNDGDGRKISASLLFYES